MKKVLVLCLMQLLVLTTWAADTEVYDFKGLNTSADITRGDALSFKVNNGSDRQMYAFTIAGVEMDCSRFGAFIGSTSDMNIALRPMVCC